MNSTIEQFDLKVRNALLELGIDFSSHFHLGAAVSGGADSIALVTSLSHILSKEKQKLSVITVDHKIRSAEESGGDVAFVASYCKKLKIPCTVHSLLPGQVHETAEKRKAGIEDAARFLRYQAFESFISSEKIDFLCLAHNQNDNLETILMRFLQGSSGVPSCGIKKRRDKFLRPMLDLSRIEIENYLNAQEITWRTDSTNSDNSYFRNRIRNELIPVLNSLFTGWKKGVLSGAGKDSVDFSYLDFVASGINWTKVSAGCFKMNLMEIVLMPEALRNRLIYRAVNELGCTQRIPFSFVQNCNRLIEKRDSVGKLICPFFGIQACISGDSFYIEKRVKTATYRGFFVIIEKNGVYELPFGQVQFENGKISLIPAMENAENLSFVLENVKLPVCIRSRQAGDQIKTSDGNYKNVNDVFSDWAVPEKIRDEIPLIQDLSSEKQELFVICGSVFGFNDWVVKK